MDQETREFLEQIADRLDTKLNIRLEGAFAEMRLFIREQFESSATRIIAAISSTGFDGQVAELERRPDLGHTQ